MYRHCAGAALDAKALSAKALNTDISQAAACEPRADTGPSGKPVTELESGCTAVPDVHVEYIGKPCTRVCVTVKLASSKPLCEGSITVKCGIDVLHVAVAGCAPSAVPLNVFVRPASCKCSVNGNILTATAEYLGVESLMCMAQRYSPIPVGSIQLQSQSLVGQLD